MKYQIKQRMDFISDTLKTKGRLNRADIMHRFGISVAQAGIDIREYVKSHPKATRYDVQKKTYLYTGSVFTPSAAPTSKEIIAELIAALETASNTVQCASLIIKGPNKGEEHIWYRMAKKAIARAKTYKSPPVKLLDERALEAAITDYYNSVRPASINDAETLGLCRSFLCNYHRAIIARDIFPEQKNKPVREISTDQFSSLDADGGFYEHLKNKISIKDN